jgi:phage replication initiation protein
MMIDYVRIRFPTNDVDQIISELLRLNTDLVSVEERAAFGYAYTKALGQIKVFGSMSGDHKLGTLLELRGQGCRQMESILLGRGETWYDFLDKALDRGGILKRLDLAVNDMADLLDIPNLIQKIRAKECISVMREYQGIISGHIFHEDDEAPDDETGTTLYIGSTKSELYFCLYEKTAEQRKKGLRTQTRNRFEVRLKNKRAAKAVDDLLCYRDEEKTIFGIVTRYLRFVDARPGTPRLKWPTNRNWARFIGHDRQPLRLTTAPEPLDLNRTRAWIDKQVAPMERVLHEIDAYWGNQKTMQSIRDAVLTDKHRQMIEQYTVEADRLENGLFEEMTPESEQSKKDDHADQSK